MKVQVKVLDSRLGQEWPLPNLCYDRFSGARICVRVLQKPQSLNQAKRFW